ncbi:unnamed protein product, partial [Ascophyllum nodosum]
EVGENTNVEGLCHFAAIVPKDGNSRPFPVQLAAPPLRKCKDKEAERLYVAELAGYTNNCMARKAARQKTEAAAAAARQRVEAAEAEARKQAQVVVE